MGCAVTGGLNVSAQVRGPRDRRYATIDFFSPIAARKALVMNGTILDGCQLVVCHSYCYLDRDSTLLLGLSVSC